MSAEKSFDIAALRARVADARGRHFWRSFEELADTQEFRSFVHREFPQQASEWLDPVGRRSFLKLMSASLALAGAACTRQPDELIVPYVHQPEHVVPGRALYFATSMPLSGSALGLLVESHEGRPTKVEGNPEHPASLGATDQFAQASVLQLYDPDRSTALTHLGEIRSWGAFVQVMRNALAERQAFGGLGLRFLTESVSSPTLAGQITEVLTAMPEARWHVYEPVNHDNAYAGARAALGQVVNTVYRFDRARVIVALDADPLGGGAGSVRYARDFASGRRVRRARAEMNRLYVAEPAPTPTGAVADHRLPTRPSRIEALARAIAAGVGGSGPAGELESEEATRWVRAVVQDLQANRGACLVVPGDAQPPAVHALAHAVNASLGNVGETVFYTEPVAPLPQTGTQTESLRQLVADMKNGEVQLLVILGGNPAYTAPVDLDFAEAMRRVPLRVHLSMYDDETSALCHWHVPETHYLEQWSDARALDGTASIVQPLIQPLYRGRSAHEVVTVFSARPERTALDAIREHWQGTPQAAEGDFDVSWRRWLHDGLIPGSAAEPLTMQAGGAPPPPSSAPGGGGLEIRFAPDPSVYDGRFANVGWLQELPKPLTKLTWDNAAMIAPATAERLGLTNEDVVEVTYRDRTVQAPIWVQPGHAPDCVTVHLGYGRTRAGRVAEGAGFNAYELRTSDAPWFGGGAELRKTGRRYRLAGTQGHHSMENRNLVRAGTLEDYRHDPEFPQHIGHQPPRTMTLYPEWKYEGYKWGMAIEQSVCTGCSACVVACVAENNIPVIGKDQVLRGREMHWLRIDRYFEGHPDAPAIYHQPMLCQHCENAPCEVVCPVAATTHSPEGLNEMTYNRCVGTRYCSHNCPYKVRRFNFLLYSDWETPSVQLVRNPDVTVRSRGVMEKCTFCVQRINRARQDAKVQDRAIRDGEVVTACQAACPTEAIVFGDLNDPTSRVSQLYAEAHGYHLLADLNTRPRISYLAALTNPHPELAPARMHDDHAPSHPVGLPDAPPAGTTERNSGRR